MDVAHKHVYSDKYKFIYHEIQKCGTQTLLDYFIRKREFDYEAHRVTGTKRIIGKSHYYRFSFVRNPWARVVSCWLSKFALYDNKIGDGLGGVKAKGLSQDTSFDKFVEFVYDTPDSVADVHFKSMHTFVTPDVHIGRLESFSRDFASILQDLHLPVFPLRKANSTSGHGRPYWSEYYTEETQRMVAERYCEDIEMFGYSFKEHT